MVTRFGPCRVIGGRLGRLRRAFSEAFSLLTKGEHLGRSWPSGARADMRPVGEHYFRSTNATSVYVSTTGSKEEKIESSKSQSVTNFISPLHDNTIHFCNISASYSCFSLALPLARHALARSSRTRPLGTLSCARPHDKHRTASDGSVTVWRPRGAAGEFLALALTLALTLALARQRIAITEPCVLFCCRSLRR